MINRKAITGFTLALDILILDQISKWLILEYAERTCAAQWTASGLIRMANH